MFWKDWMVVTSVPRQSARSLLLQVLDPERLLDVRVVAGVEVVGELRLQVAPVHHDQHRGVVERRVPAQLLAGEDHRERLARALRVPDQAGAILRRRPACRRATPCGPPSRSPPRTAGSARSSWSSCPSWSRRRRSAGGSRAGGTGFSRSRPLHRRLQRVVRVGGLRVVPPAVALRVQAEPAAPRVEVPLDVVLARVVEEHGAVAELVLVGRHAEDVRRRASAAPAAGSGGADAPPRASPCRSRGSSCTRR